MKKKIIIITILILLISSLIILINNSNLFSKPNTSYNEVSLEFDFSTEFLRLENNKQNMIYSPLSIKYALKMLNEGANENTKTQIENIIGNLDLTTYNNIDEILSLANGVFIRDTYSTLVKDDYKNTLLTKYNAEVLYDSFENATNINTWIENKTLGIIKNMLKDETVQNPLLEMVLINALAIDMEWKETFDSSQTHGKPFILENGNEMTTTMMHKETSSENFSYYQDKSITALSIDLKEYNDTQFEFIAIMPEEQNLSQYIETFSSTTLDNISKELKPASKVKHGLDISIPKFSFEYDLKLKDDLISLGITDAFDEKLADFSNMSNRELLVGDALHKANIDFTEKGIKAAAVTVILMMDKALIVEPTSPKEIKFDNPFLYVIRDKNTKEVWFVGTVYEPNSWEEDKINYEYR